MGEMDNKRLKELMAIDPEELTSELQDELFEEIKKADFFIPINITSNNLNHEDNQITSDEPVTFEFLTLKRGTNNILPLFTDEEALKQIDGFNVIKYDGITVAELLMENEAIDEIVINPNTETSLGMLKESFVYNSLKDQLIQTFNIEEDLKEYAVPLEENTKFYLRSETPFMELEAEEDIFTAKLPFKVSSHDVYHTEYPYLNVLIVPKGVMFLYLGNIIDNPESQADVILAPTIKFRLEKQEGNSYLWKCIEQNLGEEDE